MTRPSGQGATEGEDAGGRVTDAAVSGSGKPAAQTERQTPPGAAPLRRGEVAPDDGELLARVRKGDSVAFTALYERHKGWVVAVAYRFCGDRELALDVLQETFAFLLRRAPTLVLQGRLTTYLFPAVRNLSQAARRKKIRIGAGAAAERSGGPVQDAGGGAAEDSDSELQCALASLPEAQRELIYMRYVAGMMPTEIAAALGVPVGTAKSRLFAAVRAVEAVLKPRGNR
ncbi:MAG TPA: RNA polymerase sigma factor [Phycisphaerales bacterium]|nr:RNA polymerase sigma factor [Phycisphaerales bacterium]